MKVSDERPAFMLLSDDPLSPKMVVMWACFKNGDLAGALNEFNTIGQDILPIYEVEPAGESVIADALACAEEMERLQGDDDEI